MSLRNTRALLVGSAMLVASQAGFAALTTCTVTPLLTVIDAGESVILKAQCTGGPVKILNWKNGTTSLTGGDVLLSTPVPADTQFIYQTPRILSTSSPTGEHSITLVAKEDTSGAPATATSDPVVVLVRPGPVLTVTVAGDGGGVAKSSPAGINCTTGECATSFASGSAVNLQVTPNSSSTFTGWSGDCIGSAACTLDMLAARSVTATFAAITDGSCGTATQGGSTIAPTTNLCATGTPTAVASAATNFTWQCTGANNGATVPCSKSRQYTITATGGANGTITPASQAVTAGTSASLTVTPDATYTAAMGGTCSGGPLSGTVYTVATVTSDCTVTASFSNAPTNGSCGTAKNTATITAPANNLCAAGNPTAVTTGVNSFTWSCNGLNNGTNDTSCSAPRQYTVSSSVVGNGTISPATRTVIGGQTTTFTVTPQSGYGASMSVGCGAGTLVGTTYTTHAIAADCSVIATFAVQQSPSTDPGQFTGFWVPPNTTNYVVADASGLRGAGAYTYLPGCLNQQVGPNVYSGCSIAPSTVGPLAGGGTYTATMSQGKTIAVRYTAKAGAGTVSSYLFRLLGNNSGNTSIETSIWLSDVAGQSYDATSAACKQTGATKPYVLTGPTAGSCPVIPGKLYYLNARMNGACTGLGCNLIISDNGDFL